MFSLDKKSQDHQIISSGRLMKALLSILCGHTSRQSGAEGMELVGSAYRPVCMLSRFTHVRLLLTPWTVDHQAPQSLGFPRQEYWSGLPFPPPGHLPDPGVKPASPVSHALQAILYCRPTGEDLRDLKHALFSLMCALTFKKKKNR